MILTLDVPFSMNTKVISDTAFTHVTCDWNPALEVLVRGADLAARREAETLLTQMLAGGVEQFLTHLDVKAISLGG